MHDYYGVHTMLADMFLVNNMHDQMCVTCISMLFVNKIENYYIFRSILTIENKLSTYMKDNFEIMKYNFTIVEINCTPMKIYPFYKK